MRARLTAMVTAAAIAALATAAGPAEAQPSTPPPAAAAISPAQLADLLAPIALYPDDLLADVLMAASYPVQVVEADRWLRDTGVTGQSVEAWAERQPWDPSVKSLVPFPGILAMLDTHLEWTQDLGAAFVDDPAAVMAAVQGLRHRALAAGALGSTADQVVAVDGDTITISPAAPDTIAYPAYDPATVYGPSPYPDFQPYVFPEIYDGCALVPLGDCWFELAISPPLWGWRHLDWYSGRIRIDPNRFAALNGGRPPAGGATWTHDLGSVRGVPARALVPAAAVDERPPAAHRTRGAPARPVAAERPPEIVRGAPAPPAPARPRTAPRYEPLAASPPPRMQPPAAPRRLAAPTVARPQASPPPSRPSPGRRRKS